jgi:hypothetical protein
MRACCRRFTVAAPAGAAAEAMEEEELQDSGFESTDQEDSGDGDAACKQHHPLRFLMVCVLQLLVGSSLTPPAVLVCCHSPSCC